MEKKSYIYGLFGDDNIIRYIGKSDNPDKRKKEHISETNRQSTNLYKNNWIKKILRNGEKLNIVILEECTEINWVEREKHWIKYYRELGINLTNISDGGDGSSWRKYMTPYDMVKKWVQENLPNITSEAKWRNYVKNNELPSFIPKRPDSRYKNDGWVSWTDFLNTNVNYLTLEQLKKYLKTEGIKTVQEYLDKRQSNMPYRPSEYYKNDGWISWYDALDKHKKKWGGLTQSPH